MSVTSESVEEFKKRLEKMRHELIYFWEYDQKGPQSANRPKAMQKRGKGWGYGTLKRRVPRSSSRTF